MAMSMRTIYTRRRREAREWWTAASDESLPMSRRRKAFRRFRQLIDMFPQGSSMADIRVTEAQCDALACFLEMNPEGIERRKRELAGMAGLGLLLACMASLLWNMGA
jgi:hypothetical protein